MSGPIEKLMKKYFGLNDVEVQIFFSLFEPLQTNDVCMSVKLAVPSVNRYLNNLLKMGLVEREPILSEKGRSFSYRAVSHEKLAELLESKIKYAELECRHDRNAVKEWLKSK